MNVDDYGRSPQRVYKMSLNFNTLQILCLGCVIICVFNILGADKINKNFSLLGLALMVIFGLSFLFPSSTNYGYKYIQSVIYAYSYALRRICERMLKHV